MVVGYWDIGLFRLRGRVRHFYKLNNLSNLWISVYWRRDQFDLVNWFDRFAKKIRLNRSIRS